ncbi:uncharacterized protein EDB91DRAFT_1076889 [Suillus paluster]|uniref:uncharacterized protein n=1 Tax=Suillus paluster TaxID=48578 RepID=UPI001B886BBB|nr:uncharacterized protein EDB91DRAFT_1076889 [Suillus paluster]KAG1754796.1 hypothetical protein EDB91DRAFT_1076889 [Suillus paluster]
MVIMLLIMNVESLTILAVLARATSSSQERYPKDRAQHGGKIKPVSDSQLPGRASIKQKSSTFGLGGPRLVQQSLIRRQRPKFAYESDIQVSRGAPSTVWPTDNAHYTGRWLAVKHGYRVRLGKPNDHLPLSSGIARPASHNNNNPENRYDQQSPPQSAPQDTMHAVPLYDPAPAEDSK